MERQGDDTRMFQKKDMTSKKTRPTRTVTNRSKISQRAVILSQNYDLSASSIQVTARNARLREKEQQSEQQQQPPKSLKGSGHSQGISKFTKPLLFGSVDLDSSSKSVVIGVGSAINHSPEKVEVIDLAVKTPSSCGFFGLDNEFVTPVRPLQRKSLCTKPSVSGSQNHNRIKEIGRNETATQPSLAKYKPGSRMPTFLFANKKEPFQFGAVPQTSKPESKSVSTSVDISKCSGYFDQVAPFLSNDSNRTYFSDTDSEILFNVHKKKFRKPKKSSKEAESVGRQKTRRILTRYRVDDHDESQVDPPPSRGRICDKHTESDSSGSVYLKPQSKTSPAKRTVKLQIRKNPGTSQTWTSSLKPFNSPTELTSSYEKRPKETVCNQGTSGRTGGLDKQGPQKVTTRISMSKVSGHNNTSNLKSKVSCVKTCDQTKSFVSVPVQSHKTDVAAEESISLHQKSLPMAKFSHLSNERHLYKTNDPQSCELNVSCSVLVNTSSDRSAIEMTGKQLLKSPVKNAVKGTSSLKMTGTNISEAEQHNAHIRRLVSSSDVQICSTNPESTVFCDSCRTDSLYAASFSHPPLVSLAEHTNDSSGISKKTTISSADQSVQQTQVTLPDQSKDSGSINKKINECSANLSVPLSHPSSVPFVQQSKNSSGSAMKTKQCTINRSMSLPPTPLTITEQTKDSAGINKKTEQPKDSAGINKKTVKVKGYAKKFSPNQSVTFNSGLEVRHGTSKQKKQSPLGHFRLSDVLPRSERKVRNKKRGPKCSRLTENKVVLCPESDEKEKSKEIVTSPETPGRNSDNTDAEAGIGQKSTHSLLLKIPITGHITEKDDTRTPPGVSKQPAGQSVIETSAVSVQNVTVEKRGRGRPRKIKPLKAIPLFVDICKKIHWRPEYTNSCNSRITPFVVMSEWDSNCSIYLGSNLSRESITSQQKEQDLGVKIDTDNVSVDCATVESPREGTRTCDKYNTSGNRHNNTTAETEVCMSTQEDEAMSVTDTSDNTSAVQIPSKGSVVLNTEIDVAHQEDQEDDAAQYQVEMNMECTEKIDNLKSPPTGVCMAKTCLENKPNGTNSDKISAVFPTEEPNVSVFTSEEYGVGSVMDLDTKHMQTSTENVSVDRAQDIPLSAVQISEKDHKPLCKSDTDENIDSEILQLDRTLDGDYSDAIISLSTQNDDSTSDENSEEISGLSSKPSHKDDVKLDLNSDANVHETENLATYPLPNDNDLTSDISSANVEHNLKNHLEGTEQSTKSVSVVFLPNFCDVSEFTQRKSVVGLTPELMDNHVTSSFSDEPSTGYSVGDVVPSTSEERREVTSDVSSKDCATPGLLSVLKDDHITSSFSEEKSTRTSAGNASACDSEGSSRVITALNSRQNDDLDGSKQSLDFFTLGFSEELKDLLQRFRDEVESPLSEISNTSRDNAASITENVQLSLCDKEGTLDDFESNVTEVLMNLVNSLPETEFHDHQEPLGLTYEQRKLSIHVSLRKNGLDLTPFKSENQSKVLQPKLVLFNLSMKEKMKIGKYQFRKAGTSTWKIKKLKSCHGQNNDPSKNTTVADTTDFGLAISKPEVHNKKSKKQRLGKPIIQNHLVTKQKPLKVKEFPKVRSMPDSKLAQSILKKKALEAEKQEMQQHEILPFEKIISGTDIQKSPTKKSFRKLANKSKADAVYHLRSPLQDSYDTSKKPLFGNNIKFGQLQQGSSNGGQMPKLTPEGSGTRGLKGYLLSLLGGSDSKVDISNSPEGARSPQKRKTGVMFSPVLETVSPVKKVRSGMSPPFRSILKSSTSEKNLPVNDASIVGQTRHHPTPVEDDLQRHSELDIPEVNDHSRHSGRPVDDQQILASFVYDSPFSPGELDVSSEEQSTEEANEFVISSSHIVMDSSPIGVYKDKIIKILDPAEPGITAESQQVTDIEMEIDAFDTRGNSVAALETNNVPGVEEFDHQREKHDECAPEFENMRDGKRESTPMCESESEQESCGKKDLTPMHESESEHEACGERTSSSMPESASEQKTNEEKGSTQICQSDSEHETENARESTPVPESASSCSEAEHSDTDNSNSDSNDDHDKGSEKKSDDDDDVDDDDDDDADSVMSILAPSDASFLSDIGEEEREQSNEKYDPVDSPDNFQSETSPPSSEKGTLASSDKQLTGSQEGGTDVTGMQDDPISVQNSMTAGLQDNLREEDMEIGSVSSTQSNTQAVLAREIKLEGFCFDYLNGMCSRQNCRYLHQFPEKAQFFSKAVRDFEKRMLDPEKHFGIFQKFMTIKDYFEDVFPWKVFRIAFMVAVTSKNIRESNPQIRSLLQYMKKYLDSPQFTFESEIIDWLSRLINDPNRVQLQHLCLETLVYTFWMLTNKEYLPVPPSCMLKMMQQFLKAPEILQEVVLYCLINHLAVPTGIVKIALKQTKCDQIVVHMTEAAIRSLGNKYIEDLLRSGASSQEAKHKLHQALVPLSPPPPPLPEESQSAVDPDAEVDMTSDDYKSTHHQMTACMSTQSWFRLAELFIEQGTRAIKNCHYLSHYVHILFDKNSMENTVEYFISFLKNVFHIYHRDAESDALLELDKRTLARIGFHLIVRICEKKDFKHALLLLDAILQSDLPYQILQPIYGRSFNCTFILACLAMEAIEKAVIFVKGLCPVQVHILGENEDNQYWGGMLLGLVDKTKNFCLLDAMDVLMFTRQQIDVTDLESYMGVCDDVFKQAMAQGDLDIAVKLYRMDPTILIPSHQQNLLYECFYSNMVPVAEEIANRLSKLPLFEQTLTYPFTIKLLTRSSFPHKLIMVKSYLNDLYNHFCEIMSRRGQSPLDNEIGVVIIVHNDYQGVGDVNRVLQMLDLRWNRMETRFMLDIPTLKQYMKKLDCKARRQGLFYTRDPQWGHSSNMNYRRRREMNRPPCNPGRGLRPR